MDLVEYYYEHAYGCYPFEDDEPKMRTQKIIDYLHDNNVSETRIMAVIEQASKQQKGWLEPHDVLAFEVLWENSLINSDAFYYHPVLQIRPPAPTFNPLTGKSNSSSFYLEMRIQFTKKDLLDYVRKELKMPLELADDTRDLGAIDFLLKKYGKIAIAAPLDFVLYLVDEMRDNNRRAISVLDIAQAENEVYELFQKMVPEMTAKKANRIVWR